MSCMTSKGNFISREDDISTLRILVATDCHLGYMEKDEIRRHDSFYAFEEICSIAEQKQVDFVLLGGDLFHENKPSRTTLIKTIEILRRYCLNDRPVQFQVVSDQTINFANVFGHVNYEDPNFNVGLPVFTIHGNHDDPAGVDNLSAIDILSACNLVNYFGKMVLGGSGVGQITLYPILIRKDVTSVALYGLGNIRDERLNRMFQTPHAVQWMRPEPQEGCPMSDWFNILVLHQNRIKTNPKNAINEQFLPRFLDFVIWGHEHECLIDPQEVSGMGFHLTQPGSSVATSLIDGEAKPKHVLLLEIKGSQYRPTKIPLQSVRPFEYKEVVLRDDPDLDPNDQTAVLEYLDKLVRDMIVHAEGRVVSRPDLKIPLVRIKVDYTGFTTINPQRFGQKFVGKVANPHDVLLFSKSTRRQQSVDEKIQDAERLRPEELNQQNIEALVAESNLKMEILPVNDLDVALHEFVNKDDKLAFSTCVQQNLEETRNKLVKEAEVLQIKEEDDVVLKVGQCMQERERDRALHPKTGFSGGLGSQTSQVTKTKKSSQLASQNAFSDEEDEHVKVTKSKTVVWGQKTKSSQVSTVATDVADSRGRGTRGRGRGRGSRSLKQTTLDVTLGKRHSERSASAAASAALHSVIDDVEDVDSPSSDEIGKDELDEPENGSEPDETPKSARGRKRPAPQGRGKGRAASSTAKRGRKSGNSVVRQMFIDDDEDENDNNEPITKTATPQVSRNWGSLRR
ncbi:double-strand break repair protein MRE11 isoform X3 [Cryptomeria japonica]|uniref:double-strand break repair protein MRE11 isoform X3 n=1 Tax=Cryptomeria japonica TaxID=3369 RepID=UPI0025AB9410|nr:double-strand break repair protein MRE11 isoform X3 [Cryptomeria japonica]